jgi:hypothetical protein
VILDLQVPQVRLARRVSLAYPLLDPLGPLETLALLVRQELKASKEYLAYRLLDLLEQMD